MPEPLLYSMVEFRALILACLDAAEARDVVEIGAEYRGMSTLLAEQVGRRGGTLRSIEPNPQQDFAAWAAAAPAVTHLAQPSLAVLPHLAGADAWLIDGDHNWYTVVNELAAIEANSRAHGKSLLVFLHDVCWPWGRRDLYSAPDLIPAAARQEYAFGCGVTLDSELLSPGGGFRIHGNAACAVRKGGPRNGVMTAVEDFLAAARATERRLTWRMVPAVFGLGVIYDADAPWAGTLDRILAPWHENMLLAALEYNRLTNYLTVLRLQDRLNAPETVQGWGIRGLDVVNHLPW